MTFHAGQNTEAENTAGQVIVNMQKCIDELHKSQQELRQKNIALETLCAEAMGEQPKEWRDRFKQIIKPSVKPE